MKNLLITGASRGLGYHLTDLYLRKDFRVFVLSRHLSTELGSLGSQYKDRLFFIQVDVMDESSILKAVLEVEKINGILDIIINNAAVHLENSRPDILETDFKAVEETLSINAVGPLRITRHFLPMLLKGDKKMLVNISSEAGSIAGCWRLSEFGYCMSKAALNMQSKILQNRLKSEGVKVLVIHPGWLRTDMGGIEAPALPEDAASAIIGLIERKWRLDDPIFIDWNGKTINW